MKKFLFLTFLLLPSLVQAEDPLLKTVSDMTDSVTQDVKYGVSVIDTSSTFKLFYTDIRSGISALSQGLKVGAEHVYVVLVRQQVVKAITVSIFGLVGIFLLFFWLRALKSDEVWQKGDVTVLGIVRSIQIFFGTIFLLVLVIGIKDVITGFFNPEYGAIMDIIEMAKNVTQ